MFRNPKTTLLALTLTGTATSLNANVSISDKRPVLFHDLSSIVGLINHPDTKYGGPTIADINSDGRYDIIVFNHNQTPVMYFQANEEGGFDRKQDIFGLSDIHSVAPGDFDRDGDLDTLISLGGGSGTNPKPPRMMRNDGEAGFTNITEPSGISKLGARGRSVRWLDLDLDGNLDFISINKPQEVRPDWPRNLLYRGLGDGTFEHAKNELFENLEAEKSIVSDIDDDRRPDLLTFGQWEKLSVLRGLPEMQFEDVSERVLPKALQNLRDVFAIAHADIDGDGDMDYYIARGGSHLNLVNHCCDYHRLDVSVNLADKMQHSLTFAGDYSLQLLDFSVMDRGTRMHDGMPVYVGSDKLKINPPAGYLKYLRADQAKGFPEEMDKTGWYLGHLGKDQWKLSYFQEADNLAWSARGSILGVHSFETDWVMHDPNLPDVLLRNDNGVFTDISFRLPEETKQNSRGVTPGDFNNDGLVDFMVFRYGTLSQRAPDLILLNRGDDGFETFTNHGGTDLSGLTHGDMGIAFDYDGDGDMDVVSGDENGSWKLFSNQLKEQSSEIASSNYLLIRVNYSESGIDSIGAKLTLTTKSSTQTRIIGSGGAAFSQCLLNIVHFGLGSEASIEKLTISWRDGSEEELTDIKANQQVQIGPAMP
ncbi:MAG: CRTAC1 family protein [Lentimonas sp.]